MTAALALGSLVLLTQPTTARSASNPPPAFLTYAPPATYQAVVANGIQVPLRDGSSLSCDLYRPGDTASTPSAGRFPGVVYQYHGYGTNRAQVDPAQLQLLAGQGYNALQCSVRGSGGSPGTIDILGPSEARDGYDIVEWLAAQSWSNAQIGMVGYSYGAITAYLVAALRPPHLRTIVPQASYEDIYRDIGHLGGVRGADVRGWLLALLETLNTVGTPPQQTAAIEQQGMRVDQEMGNHPLRDSYWGQYEIDFSALASSGIPILDFGGWYDIYQRGMPAAYQRLPGQTWLVMNNVSHVDTGPTFYGKSGGPTLAWLDHWLKGRASAPFPSVHVISYEMPAMGGSGWTAFATWPPPGVQATPLHMNGDGSLGVNPSQAGTTSYVVNPLDGMPSYWNVGTRPDSPAIVAWNTAREAQRVHFTSSVLQQDLVMAGEAQASVLAAFSATDGYLVARLTDVAPDGSVNLVATGWLQASVSPDYRSNVPVPPGRSRLYTIWIWPSHWRFLAGHRVQVSVSSGDVPRIMPDAPAGSVVIGTGMGGSSLTLPVLGESTPDGGGAPSGQPTSGDVRPTSAASARPNPNTSATSASGGVWVALVLVAAVGIRRRQRSRKGSPSRLNR